MDDHADTLGRRRANLRRLIDEWGTQQRLASALAVTPGYINQLVCARRPITEKTARVWEKRLALPVGWIDKSLSSAPLTG